MVQVDIKPVEYKDKEVLRNLMEYYLYDFSEMEGFDVYPHGRFEYNYLDHYWTEEERFPYFILVDGLYAGFALVRKCQEGLLKNNSFSMAEFFIMRKYRRNGIGESAALQVFDKHHGIWEVGEIKSNKGALAFWQKVIQRYTDGNYQDHLLDNEEWRGTLQVFNNQVGNE